MDEKTRLLKEAVNLLKELFELYNDQSYEVARRIVELEDKAVHIIKTTDTIKDKPTEINELTDPIADVTKKMEF